MQTQVAAREVSFVLERIMAGKRPSASLPPPHSPAWRPLFPGTSQTAITIPKLWHSPLVCGAPQGALLGQGGRCRSP